MRIHYDVSWERPQRHLFEVEMTVSGAPAGELTMQIPAWIPGVYEIIDSAMLVQDLEAEAGGKRLRVERADKHTWQVRTGSARRVVIRWRSYANTLSCASNHLDETHAHITGGTFFPYVVGAKDAPHSLKLRAPRGWRVSTGLTPGSQRNTFQAEDYDTFIDCPIEVGKFRQESFTVAGVPHHVVIQEYGHEEENLARLIEDTARFVRYFRRMFGGFPFREYWFQIHAHPSLCHGGALEHHNSTHLTLPYYLDDPDPVRYQWFVSVMSHEYFHAWNVKRMRPAGLGPFDYTKEVHTRGLWVAEGLTEYYCLYALRRAGVWTRQQFLDWIAYFVDRYHDMPGRRAMTVREASFDTWTRAFWHPRREHETNALNTFVDYYTKGALVGWLLDMEVRRRTRGTHDLDRIMVEMFRRHGAAAEGFDDTAFQRATEEVTGLSFASFFRQALDGTGKLPFRRTSREFGLELAYRPAKPEEEKHALRRKVLGRLGLEIDVTDGKVSVRNVLPESAAEEAGIDRGDELIAVDGERLEVKDWRTVLADGEPGSTREIALFRHGRLLTRRVTIGDDARLKTDLKIASGLRGARKRDLEAWLGPESKERPVPSARA